MILYKTREYTKTKLEEASQKAKKTIAEARLRMKDKLSEFFFSILFLNKCL